MGWGEPHGPSEAMVAHRVRLEAADDLASAAGALLDAPTPEGLKRLNAALSAFQYARVADARPL